MRSPGTTTPSSTNWPLRSPHASAAADAVLVFDPSAFAKKGTASVGVQRQWCGRLGKVENGQVGVFLGYVSGAEHALVDVRLYLPKEWAKDRKRRKKAGVPKEVRYRTRHELALEMLGERGPALPHCWVAGDDEMGRRRGSASALADRERAIPAGRAVEHEHPRPGGSSRRVRGAGRRPKVPFRGVRAWCAAAAGRRRGRSEVRDGEKGPLDVEIVARRVEAKVDRRVVGREDTGGGPLPGRRCEARLLPVQRRADDAARGVGAGGQGGAPDRGVSAASQERGRTGRVPGAELAGLASPQTLSLIATWFLVSEARRGKKDGAGVDGAAGACWAGVDPAPGQRLRYAKPGGPGADALAGAERVGTVLSLQGT